MQSFTSLANNNTVNKQFDPLGFFKLNSEGELILDEVNKAAEYQALKDGPNLPDFNPNHYSEYPTQ